MDPSSFSIEFQQGKEYGVWGGFVVVCEWTREAEDKEEEKIRTARRHERDAFKYAFLRSLSGQAAGWRGTRDSVRKSPMGRCQSLCGSLRRGQLVMVESGRSICVYMMWVLSCLLLSKLA